MRKDSFLKLQRELKPAVQWSHSLVDLGVHFLLLFFFISLLGLDSTLAYVASQLLLGIIIVRSLFLMHDCAHGAMTKNETVNLILGHFFGAFCFLPYYQWRYLHLKHHSYTAIREMDPLLIVTTQKDSSQLIKYSRGLLNFLWKMGFPYAEMIRSLGYLLSPLIILKNRKKDQLFFVSAVASLGFVIGFWLLARKLAPDVVTLMNIVPGLIIYMFLNELVSLPQHLELPSADKSYGRFALWDHTMVTRSVRFPAIIERHILLNFNMHMEHHVFPRLPWRQLPEARTQLKKEMGQEYLEANWDWSLKRRKGTMSEILTLKDLPQD